MCLSIQWWRQRNKEGSRCLQLQTRLRGGVDGGEACRVSVHGEYSEGYRGVRAGPGGGRRGGVWSYDLKEPFLWSFCQHAPQQIQSQVSLVLLAELMRACALRAGALMFWAPCVFSPALLPCLSHIKNEWGVEKQMFWGMYLYRVHFIHPLLHTPFVLCFSISAVVQLESFSLSLYPTKHTKSPYFIHIIILSIKVGNFYLS